MGCCHTSLDFRGKGLAGDADLRVFYIQIGDNLRREGVVGDLNKTSAKL